MVNNWKEVCLGDICTIRRGSSPRPIVDFITDQGMPWVKIADATKSNSKIINHTKQFIKEEGVCKSVIVEKGDLILSNSGTAGLPKFMGITACVHDGWQVFKDLNGITSEFLYYSLIYIRKTLVDGAYDSTMKNLTLDMVRDAKIKLPPLSEQNAITKVLCAIDDKIETNRIVNKTLEQMGQVLFKSWFIDFDPVIDNALAEGANVSDFPEALQQRSEQRKQAQQLIDYKPLPDKIINLFPSEFEQANESSIGIRGWIPKGWKVKCLSELLEVKYGKDHKKLNEGLYPVYGSGGLMRNAEKFLYEGESVLIPRKGTLTNIMYVNEKFWTVDTMFYTIPKLENIAKFVFYHLKTLDFTAMNVGSAVPSMTTKVLNTLQIITPSNELLQKFDEIIGINNQKVVLNQNNTQQLEKLRNTLLPKLISGELKIAEID